MAVSCETPKPSSKDDEKPKVVTLEQKLENAEFGAAVGVSGFKPVDFASGYRTAAQLEEQEVLDVLSQ